MGLDSNSLICPSGVVRMEPTGRANARPMTGSAMSPEWKIR
jgi:hypothetical protein